MLFRTPRPGDRLLLRHQKAPVTVTSVDRLYPGTIEAAFLTASDQRMEVVFNWLDSDGKPLPSLRFDDIRRTATNDVEQLELF